MSDRIPKRKPLSRASRNRPIACVNHTPNFEPDCFACRALLEMILRMDGEVE